MAKQVSDEKVAKSRRSDSKRSSMTFESAMVARSRVEREVLPVISELENRTHMTVTESSLDRIISNFTRMERGSKVDDRTPLFKNQPRKQVVSGFDRIVRSNVEKLGITPEFPQLFQEVEEGQRSNIGPMSMFVPAHVDCRDKIGAVMSDKPLPSTMNARALDLALKDVENLLPAHTISRVSLEEAYNGLSNKPETALDPETNSGWPYCLSGWNKSIKPGKPGRGGPSSLSAQARERVDMQTQIYNGAKDLISYAMKGGPYEGMVNQFVALSFQRTVQKGPDQLKSPKAKRYVLAMPKEEIVAGKTIQIPLQQAIKHVRNPNGVYVFPAFHPKPILDIHMQGLLSTAHKDNRLVLSGDISGYDQSLPPGFMWMVAKAMSKWMTNETARLFLGLMYADIFKTCVLSPVGLFESGPSSIKSGSIFTSIGGCIWNYAIQRYGHHAGYFTITQQCCMGDDFLIDGDGVTPESIAQTFADFKMEAHPDKQFFHKDSLHFLQQTHVYGFPGGMGSVYRILGNSLSVEDDTRMEWDERNRYAYQLQAIQRLNNAIFNPLAGELISYVQKGDVFALGARDSAKKIIAKGGTYVERKLRDLKSQHWRTTVDMEFEDWAINRVLRGEELAPPGEQRFRQVYGFPFKLDLNFRLT